MAGISSKAAGKLENKMKYNGIEFDEDLDIDSYEAFYRNLDPQIGRFWQIDPKVEFGMESWSPYASNRDNPLRYNDPLGDLPGDEDASSRKSLFNPPSTETVSKYPAIALLQEVGYLAWNLLGGSSVENFVINRRDGKNSVAEITEGVVNVGLSTARGEGPVGEKVVGEVNAPVTNTKLNGKLTEPKLPDKTIASDGKVEVVHYTRSGDHGPAHMHVKGGGEETKIGQNGKPIKGSPELTKQQQQLVDQYSAQIRKAAKQIMKWFNYNSQ